MAQAERLTSTERKIAEVLAGEPQTIAFGTVAQVAQRAGTSGPSVVRLAVKLGYDGFVGLQADVQSELARQLGPARDRIRQRLPTDFLARVQAAEQDNVLQTLHGISTAALDRSIARLADRHRRVWVLPAEMTTPIGLVLASQLGQLREGVTLLQGSEVAVSRALAGLEPCDTLISHRHPPLRAIRRRPDASGPRTRGRRSSRSPTARCRRLAAGAVGDVLHLGPGGRALRQRDRRDRPGQRARRRAWRPGCARAPRPAWTPSRRPGRPRARWSRSRAAAARCRHGPDRPRRTPTAPRSRRARPIPLTRERISASPPGRSRPNRRGRSRPGRPDGRLDPARQSASWRRRRARAVTASGSGLSSGCGPGEPSGTGQLRLAGPPPRPPTAAGTGPAGPGRRRPPPAARRWMSSSRARPCQAVSRLGAGTAAERPVQPPPAGRRPPPGRPDRGLGRLGDRPAGAPGHRSGLTRCRLGRPRARTGGPLPASHAEGDQGVLVGLGWRPRRRPPPAGPPAGSSRAMTLAKGHRLAAGQVGAGQLDHRVADGGVKGGFGVGGQAGRYVAPARPTARPPRSPAGRPRRRRPPPPRRGRARRPSRGPRRSRAGRRSRRPRRWRPAAGTGGARDQVAEGLRIGAGKYGTTASSRAGSPTTGDASMAATRSDLA